jgi:EAL domain-containing protein (putative c-di-GMP-specific phosphodiesterase class I)
MSRSFVHQKWKERLRMLCLLPLPNQSLKYFPPSFTLRDPVLSLVHEAQLEGKTCALLLFCPDESCADQLFIGATTTGGSFSFRNMFVKAVTKFIDPGDILGVKQFGENDCCVLVNMGLKPDYDLLNSRTNLLRLELEKQFQETRDVIWRAGQKLQSACYFLDNNTRNPSESIHTAYRYAYSIATKKLPDNFTVSRRQMLQILETDNVSVMTQPIMDLKTGDVFGWEVLARGPENTPFYNPMNLFEFAFQANLLQPMEFLVIRKALQDISRLNIREQVFINVTSHTLTQGSLLDKMLGWLEEFPSITPRQIVMEITERHAIHDFDQMGVIVRSFRQHGFRFAIDDAGSGYSSLNTISELVPDIIKIDKSVIQNIDQQAMKQNVLKALMHFAENINCQVVAEGIEREEEANLLYLHQVHMGQGFYFARPQPIPLDNKYGHYASLREKVTRLRQTGSE